MYLVKYTHNKQEFYHVFTSVFVKQTDPTYEFIKVEEEAK